jgi:hypothetical protein
MRLIFHYFIALALAITASSFLLPARFRGPYPHPPGPDFDKTVSKLYLHQIEKRHPQIVLLGDSILTKGVSEEDFQDRIGAPTYKLDIPGSSSALWYLVVKSNIVVAEPAPQTLVILFRDTLLTASTFRTTGPYFGLIDKFAEPDDSLLLQNAYLAQLTPLQSMLEQYFPLYTYRGRIRESVDEGLRHILPAAMGCDSSCADDAMTGVLGDIQPDIFARSIVDAEQAIYTPEQLDFGAQVGRSFLPAIIGFAHKRGIQLILVRAPTNIFPDPASEPQGLRQYMEALSRYLAKRDVVLLDLSRTPGIGPQQFADPHHMTLEGKAVFTQVLARTLKSYIRER